MDSLLPHLVARMDPNGNCTPQTCDPSQSIYGYRPSLPATLVFLIVFALSGVVYCYQGVKTRTWFFSVSMVIGCLSEVLGYVAKLLLWHNPFGETGFIMSVVLLTFAPAFYSAGIYYTLKHICLTFGPEFSRLKPSWYTWIFISGDWLAIVLQAAGGATASVSETDSVLQAGDNIMIAGLALQVFTMAMFGLFAIDYAFAIYRHRDSLNPATANLRNSRRFKLFIVALWVAYIAILVRCCYRLAELANGWDDTNEILRNQWLFVGLDSVPCAIASLLLNVWHPGYCFPKEERSVASWHMQAASVSSSNSSHEEIKEEAKEDV